jgi:hypothetical protein
MLVVCCHCEQSPGLRRMMIVRPDEMTSGLPKQTVTCVCGARYEVEIRVREVAP